MKNRILISFVFCMNSIPIVLVFRSSQLWLSRQPVLRRQRSLAFHCSGTMLSTRGVQKIVGAMNDNSCITCTPSTQCRSTRLTPVCQHFCARMISALCVHSSNDCCVLQRVRHPWSVCSRRVDFCCVHIVHECPTHFWKHWSF